MPGNDFLHPLVYALNIRKPKLETILIEETDYYYTTVDLMGSTTATSKNHAQLLCSAPTFMFRTS